MINNKEKVCGGYQSLPLKGPARAACRRALASRLAGRLKRTTIAMLLAGLSACAVGPDFKTPDSPDVTAYGETSLPEQTVSAPKARETGVAQRFLLGGDISAAWWELLESPPLTAMIAQAVQSSPTLTAARAALRVARETARAGSADFFPSLDGGSSDNRQKITPDGEPYTLYNASVSVTYAPDVFGAMRRTAESLDAAQETKQFELEAAYLALTANIVTTAIQAASLSDQISAQKAVITAQEKLLVLTKARLDAGATSQIAYLAQAQALESAKALLPPLESQKAAARHLLSTLQGRFPAKGGDTTFTLASFKLPQTLPVSLPSRLVEQRPDIRAARANLRAANAEIGIAMAAMLPQFPLTAGYGVSAIDSAALFGSGAGVWGLGAGILQPLFHGGQLLHKKRAKEAAFDQAAATYRGVVLAAFLDVANALKAIETDAQTLAAQSESDALAAQNLSVVEAQFKAGSVDHLALLSAQAARATSSVALIKAKAARLANTAALFQALGGGWWNRKDENQ